MPEWGSPTIWGSHKCTHGAMLQLSHYFVAYTRQHPRCGYSPFSFVAQQLFISPSLTNQIPQGYIGLLLGFLFLTLAIASGLYYLSELVEEHTVLSKKLLTRLIYTIIALQILLLIDRFPLHLTLLSIGSHVIYLQNLRRFPIVKLTDPVFLLSCVLVLANHWLWFRHFSKEPEGSGRRYDYYRLQEAPTFTEIASFFGLCVWLVPFALFVSLSAGENVSTMVVAVCPMQGRGC